ncbi:DNA helicase UvrD [Candidatus Woesearchaeota archaeon CG08_land_8_20_14_0_20_43_7]|nr:MAG: DNA helicase UvrD [Candidatus Woesearchaeota archaeon CG08_land_8_20_14_0_20_43_7]
MKIFSDLHIHSRYSRGCSTKIDIENLEKHARLKGITLLGTGDFTHPEWLKELKEKLTEDEGILRTANDFPFMLQTEISLVYTQDGKGRRIHNVVLAPSFEVVDQINDFLLTKGRLDYDGRPIFKIPCPEFVESLRKIDRRIEVIPAHIWTPWFSLFGSKSGFDSVKDCFQDQTQHIHAMETGLSSDPAMNWRLKQLDRYALVSFSDSHSFWPWRIGREQTIFDVHKLTYNHILHAIRTKEGIDSTIEFWPHEGKYHYDGHRNCDVCIAPSETMRLDGICPKCGRPLTIGVAYRVEELADREEGARAPDARQFKNIIPLSECIAGILKTSVTTKKVWAAYNDLIKTFGNEMAVLLDAPADELLKVIDKKVADVIIRNRNEKIEFAPGYDGVYGVPLFYPDDIEKQQAEIKKIEGGDDGSKED